MISRGIVKFRTAPRKASLGQMRGTSSPHNRGTGRSIPMADGKKGLSVRRRDLKTSLVQARAMAR